MKRKIKETIWYIQYNFIFEKYYIRIKRDEANEAFRSTIFCIS